MTFQAGSSRKPESHSRQFARAQDYQRLEHAPDIDVLNATTQQICDVKPLLIRVPEDFGGRVAGFLHLPQNFTQRSHHTQTTGAILLSGAGGGVVGPSGIYMSIGDKLASLKNGMPVLRLDYRYPARTGPCVEDVVSAMNEMEQAYGVSHFVLVGWSFGGSPVFTVGGLETTRVVGCATLASQTASTQGITKMSPRPILLLHGTADERLGASCSQSLYEAYGSNGSRTLKLFKGGDHAFTRYAAEAEAMLCDFIMSCAGVQPDAEGVQVLQKTLVPEQKRVEVMKKGGDLRGQETIR